MGSSVSWHKEKLVFLISEQYINVVRQFITTVNINRATTSLFQGEVVLEWNYKDSGECELVLEKMNDLKFVYEEIEGLLDRIFKIVPDLDREASCRVLQEAGVALSSRYKVFIPRNKYRYHVAVYMDYINVRFICVENVEKFAERLYKAYHDVGAHISIENNVISVAGYAGKVDFFVSKLVDVIVDNKMCDAKDREWLISEIDRFILHDIVDRELLSLNKLAGCAPGGPMLNHRESANRAVTVFKSIAESGSFARLSEEDKNFIRDGAKGEGVFKNCPPILLRSFERLMARVTNAT